MRARSEAAAPRRLVFGAALVAALVAGCTTGGGAASGAGSAITVSGVVQSGPTCPVERNPPDPRCAPRPVEGAVLVVQDAAGRQVAQVTSAADGTFVITLSPGGYRLVPQPVKGLLGTATPVDLTVRAGIVSPPVTISYDTGIR